MDKVGGDLNADQRGDVGASTGREGASDQGGGRRGGTERHDDTRPDPVDEAANQAP